VDRRAFLSLAGAALIGAPRREPSAAAPPRRIGDDICLSPSAPPIFVASTGPGGLSYHGTHILAYGALMDIAPAFMASRGKRLAVAGGGCDDGIAGVMRRVSDFGGMCCPVEGSRADGLPHLVVARDMKAVIAHGANPVAGLSFAQLKAIARGTLLDWRDLGGAARPIAQVVRRHCAEYAEPVRTTLLPGGAAWSANALFVDTDEQIIDLVSRFPAGLGIVSWVFARPLVAAGKLRLLALDGLRPDRDPARYPLTGALSIVFGAWDPVRMTPFFDFLYGPQGRSIVARGLIPVSAGEAGYRGAATFGRG